MRSSHPNGWPGRDSWLRTRRPWDGYADGHRQTFIAEPWWTMESRSHLRRATGRDPAKVEEMEQERFERPPTAQLAVLTELRRRIVHGEIAPGQPIRQETLAAELGVSRLPVREALMVLEAEQLVSYEQHRGYVATGLDPDDLVQIYRLRELLEAEAIIAALPNLTEQDLNVMRGAVERMEQMSESETKEFLDQNRLFHFTLFQASRNARLVALLRQLWDSCDRYRVLYVAVRDARGKLHSEHREILNAAAARDTGLMLKLADEHRSAGLASALRVFEAQTKPATKSKRRVPSARAVKP